MSSAAVSDEAAFDKQLGYFAITCLVALASIVVFLFIAFNSFGTLQKTLQTSVNNNIALIQAILPPAIKSANIIVNTTEGLINSTFGSITYAVDQGIQQVTNVGLSVGQTLLNAISIGFAGLLDLMEEIGTQTLQFFENALAPLVVNVQAQGESIIQQLQIFLNIFTPILTLISDIYKEIARIGTLF